MEAMKAVQRWYGVVFSCMSKRGFGFLKDESDGEWFFHYSNYNGEPRPGAVVSFELADPNRLGQRAQAVNIEVLEDGPDLAGLTSLAVNRE